MWSNWGPILLKNYCRLFHASMIIWSKQWSIKFTCIKHLSIPYTQRHVNTKYIWTIGWFVRFIKTIWIIFYQVVIHDYYIIYLLSANIWNYHHYIVIQQHFYLLIFIRKPGFVRIRVSFKINLGRSYFLMRISILTWRKPKILS